MACPWTDEVVEQPASKDAETMQESIMALPSLLEVHLVRAIADLIGAEQVPLGDVVVAAVLVIAKFDSRRLSAGVGTL
jgi:hypothetical protein